MNGTNGMKLLIDCVVGRLMRVEVEKNVVAFDFYSIERQREVDVLCMRMIKAITTL